MENFCHLSLLVQWLFRCLLTSFLMCASCTDSDPQHLPDSRQKKHKAKAAPAKVKGPVTITPVDPKLLWHLFGKNGINIEPAWAITKGSTKTTLAVLDSGFMPLSEAFTGCPSRYEYLDYVTETPASSDHGASVASLLSTCPGNPFRLLGVNNISPVIWLESAFLYRNSISLLGWAIKSFDCLDKEYIDCPASIVAPVDVLNASFGVGHEEIDQEEREDIHVSFLRLSEIAKKQGTILVAAAGNEGKNADAIFPHSLSGVVSAGASNKNGTAAKFSNWGETVDTVAPGQGVPTLETTGFAYASGTSLASPIVAGVVSLMKAVYPDLNWKTAIYYLQFTAVPMDCAAYCIGRKECEQDCCNGSAQICTPGRMDAGAAVAAASDAAKNGLPLASLVDSDKFFVDLYPLATGVKGKVRIRNVGGKQGSYQLSADNSYVEISPSFIHLEKKGSSKDSVEVVLSSKRPYPGWTNIAIKSPESVTGVTGYSDEIVISADRLR